MDIFDDLKIKETPNLKEIGQLFNNWGQKSSNENSLAASDKIRQLLIESKESPFEEVSAKRSKEGAKMLSHEQAGDVLLIAKQGYYIAQDEWATVKEADELGNHGGNPEREELRPILFMIGNNYLKKEY